jgi:hypothetical protein
MTAISKIQQLNNVESFLQINFVKGYKYIDKAGEVVNYFYKDSEPPRFTMDLGGLIITNPGYKIDAIKISSDVFWAHFLSPDSLEQIDSYFGKKSQDIMEILQIAEISRLGWRNYLVCEFTDVGKRDAILNKFQPIEGLNLEDITYVSECMDLSLNIKIRKVSKKDESALPGILIDVDFYKQYKEYLPSPKIVSQLLEFKRVVRSDKFLEIVNSILTK